jgi:hypothetical protein
MAMISIRKNQNSSTKSNSSFQQIFCKLKASTRFGMAHRRRISTVEVRELLEMLHAGLRKRASHVAITSLF